MPGVDKEKTHAQVTRERGYEYEREQRSREETSMHENML